MVEVAEVGQAPQPQSKQLIDSEKFKSVMIVIIFRSPQSGHKWSLTRTLRTSQNFRTFQFCFHHSSDSGVLLDRYTLLSAPWVSGKGLSKPVGFLPIGSV
jgi:hypothetical protein